MSLNEVSSLAGADHCGIKDSGNDYAEVLTSIELPYNQTVDGKTKEDVVLNTMLPKTIKPLSLKELGPEGIGKIKFKTVDGEAERMYRNGPVRSTQGDLQLL